MRFPRRHRRTFESLEDRCLLAADVAVEQLGRHLFITGNELGSDMLIRGTAEPGQFIISYFRCDPPSAEPPTLITVEGVFGDIFVQLGGGDDRLSIYDAHVLGNLNIDMGTGADEVSLAGGSAWKLLGFEFDRASFNMPLEVDGDLRFAGGEGRDVFAQTNTTVHGNQHLDMGAGNDVLVLEAYEGLNAVGETLSVNLGDGADEALFQAFEVGSLIVQDLSGDSQLNFSGTVNGSAVIKTGPGNDQVGTPLTDFSLGFMLTVGENLAISTGDGNDQINSAVGSVGGSEMIFTGSGDDSVMLLSRSIASAHHQPLHVGGDLSIDLGAGVDDATITDIELGGTLEVRSAEGGEKRIRVTNSAWIAEIAIALTGNSSDGVYLGDLSAGQVVIETNDGRDWITLSHSSVDTLFAALGNDDDHMALIDITAANPSLIDGGDGRDWLSFFEIGLSPIESRNFEAFGIAEG